MALGTAHNAGYAVSGTKDLLKNEYALVVKGGLVGW